MLMQKTRALIAIGLLAGMATACDRPAAEDLTRPDTSAGPKVYFANLRDGQTVSSPFKVVFGLKEWGVAPAGVDKPKTGHHHLLINTTLSEEEMQYAIPMTDNHRHFGGGQTEVVLDLPPGQHTLQLILGDMNHELFTPPIMSDIITVTVK
ncbi:MAG: DUF4399 domain-containing protein [Sphingomonadales bacterium]